MVDARHGMSPNESGTLARISWVTSWMIDDEFNRANSDMRIHLSIDKAMSWVDSLRVFDELGSVEHGIYSTPTLSRYQDMCRRQWLLKGKNHLCGNLSGSSWPWKHHGYFWNCSLSSWAPSITPYKWFVRFSWFESDLTPATNLPTSSIILIMWLAIDV